MAPKPLWWHRSGPCPTLQPVCPGAVGCGRFALLWHSPFESAKRLPNRDGRCQPARRARRHQLPGPKSSASSIVSPLRVSGGQLDRSYPTYQPSCPSDSSYSTRWRRLLVGSATANSRGPSYASCPTSFWRDIPLNTTWRACSPSRSMGTPLAPPVNGGVATSRVPLAGPLGSSERGPNGNRTTSRPGGLSISTFVIRSEGRRLVWRTTAQAAADAAADAVGLADGDSVAGGVAVAVAVDAEGVGVNVGAGDAVGPGVVVAPFPQATTEIAMRVAHATPRRFMPGAAWSGTYGRRRRRAAAQGPRVSSRVDLQAMSL